MCLVQEFWQDGFYQFVAPENLLTVAAQNNGRKVSGKLLVVPMGGNQGEFSISMEFDAAGKLGVLDETGKLVQGMRPICQATKLLDADPLVRRMAEQDLLIMGRSAESYLREQQAKASPELREAIDRIW